MPKGVCTSPNGVAGCQSRTCPAGTANANLVSFRNTTDAKDKKKLMKAIAEDILSLSSKELVAYVNELRKDEQEALLNAKPVKMRIARDKALLIAMDRDIAKISTKKEKEAYIKKFDKEFYKNYKD